MSLKIRLTRGGAKKRPYYRIVVADARAPRDGRFIDKVGAYDPMKAKDDPARIVLDNEKIQSWLAKGAQPTDRVLRCLDAAGLAKRPARTTPQKAEPGEKSKERAEERASREAEQAAAAAEAAATAAGGNGGDGEAADAPNEGQSTSDPAEGAPVAAPADGAEKAA